MSSLFAWIEENLEDILWGFSSALIAVLLVVVVLWHTRGKSNNKWNSTGW